MVKGKVVFEVVFESLMMLMDKCFLMGVIEAGSYGNFVLKPRDNTADDNTPA